MTEKTFAILEQARVYDGFFKIDAYHLTSTGIDAPYVREVFQRGNSAAVLAYDPEMDAVLLIEELRPGCVAAGLSPADCFSLGPIAGSMEAGEDALSTVVRESVEEAGVAIDGDRIFGPRRTMPSPGGSSEVISHFVAVSDLSGVTDGQRFGLAGEGEATVVRILPREEADKLLDNGICNGLTATLLTYLQSLIARHEIMPCAMRAEDVAAPESGPSA